MIDLDGLDMTSDEIDLAEIDKDMEQFQQEETVKEALMSGVDMRQYLRQIETDLREAEKASVADYIKESENLGSLHSQIRECDDILAVMEGMLTTFQENLGNISSEIKYLQDESFSMNIKLKNRKAVEGDLGSFVQEIMIDEELVNTICNKPVDEDFVQQLKVLDKKLKFITYHYDREVKAAYDVQQEAEFLWMKAASKIREYLLDLFVSLKKPRTNIQIRQQNTLLKYKYMMVFLESHAKDVAMEIMDVYADNLSRIYSSYFSSYIKSMSKLQSDLCGKNDLLGVPESQFRSLFSSKTTFRKQSAFALGQRIQVLDEIDTPAIVSHIAEQKKDKVPYEAIFRSIHQLLMDAATSEFLFILEFFGHKDIFHRVFQRSLALVTENVQDYLSNCYDSLSVLLCIRITREHQMIMQRRRIPSLDNYFDKINLMLWEKFKKILDMNIASVQDAPMKNLWSGASDSAAIQPNFVVRRYAEYATSIALLSGEYEQILNQQLSMVRKQISQMLQRMAEQFENRKTAMIFLINNYDLVLQVLSEHEIDSDDFIRFNEMLEIETNNFVEEELSECYGRLISFVSDVEEMENTMGKDEILQNLNANTVEALVKEFASNWKQGLEQINGNVMAFFPNL
eukprot:TRINITY_DN3916_c0_g1_i10.p1 TRINITY_DN3916_c0_g1~~TRINITY_DN3916_c0_g1_i10.p1  ORF type:complete len:704 (-),score=238.83 TRINITY_DN3916_c0_g1_i10:1057-2937(-)